MTLIARTETGIPEETVRVARAAFPHGNKYMILRDELGVLDPDETCADLFSWKGAIAQSPGRLAWVCVMQSMENLSDRQAVEAVRARLDWKDALGLPLHDAGFDASLLSTLRTRLLAGSAAERVLDQMLQLCVEKKLLGKRGQQRTDATHVLAAVRDLSRWERVGETLRQALNVLAVAVPDWLREQVEPAWFDRYASRMEQVRCPAGNQAREALWLRMGADGYQLLSALSAEASWAGLRHNPAVETLRQVWIQQYYQQDGAVPWRQAGRLPAGVQLINSPSDVEARYSKKRQTEWVGYKAHLTESCAADQSHLLVNVATTPASPCDADLVAPIHQALAAKGLLPQEHLLAAGYLDVESLVNSQTDHQVELGGPMRPDPSWQARAETGFDRAAFCIDGEAETAPCPNGQQSRVWAQRVDESGAERISVRFARADCLACPVRQQCPRSPAAPRGLTLLPAPQHIALQQARQDQQTEAFQADYQARAGIEGPISQGTRSYDLRRSRSIGCAKTHLQHLLTAAAINLARLANWFTDVAHDVPLAQRRASTRTSRFAALAPS